MEGIGKTYTVPVSGRMLRSELPYEIVTIPSWVWLKLKSKNVNLVAPDYSVLAKHLSQDEFAEWQVLSDLMVYKGSPLVHWIPSSVMKFTDEEERIRFNSMIAALSSDPDICKSVSNKLDNPGNPVGYEFIKAPGFIWVVVYPGFLYNLRLTSDAAELFLSDLLNLYIGEVPLSALAKSSIFKSYIGLIGTE